MTAIKFIRGIPRPTDPVRIDDSPKRLHGKTFKNFLLKSEGEFELQLMLDRVLIDKAYYGDPEGIYTMAENMIGNALRAGLHSSPGNTSFGILPAALKGIAGQIRAAKRKTSSAYKRVRANRVAGPFDPFGNDPFTIDCFDLQSQLQDLQNQLANLPPQVPQTVRNGLQNQIDELQEIVTACGQNFNQISLLNDKLEESAHDWTYKYFQNSEINSSQVPVIVAQKALNQRASIQRLANLAGLSESNLSLWVDNGIKRQNTRKGTQPWNGRETSWGIGYSTLDGDTDRVGGLPIAAVIGLVKAAAALISALAAALIAAKALFNSQTPDDKFQLTQTIGGPGDTSFDPAAADWSGHSLPLVDINGQPIDPSPNSGSGLGANGGLLFGGTLLLGGLLLFNNNQ